jgi:glycosyltransferase involved in cell wall biosynthesis
LVSAIAELRNEAIEVEGTVVGDGPEREALESQAQALAISNSVQIVGAVDFDRVLDFYEQAHVLVLLSKTEGWGKTLVEGMAFGLICIGPNAGAVPYILGDGRGIVINIDDETELAEALRRIAKDRQSFESMRHAAAAWAQAYSLEGLREALRELLVRTWELPRGFSPQQPRPTL